MNPLNLVIELSELLEAAGCEGRPIAQLFDEEIFPCIRKLDEKAEPFGLGDRFARVLEKVRATVDQHGADRVRTLRDIMKSALMTYVKKTHDAVTARDAYHRAIMSGSDVMFTVAAATFIANALAEPHPDQAKLLMQQVAGRLTGRQPVPAMENCSAAAVGSGAIAVAAKGMKKKRRRDSIFAENDAMSWDDLIGNPAALDILREVGDTGNTAIYDGVMIDPTTAELVLSVHHSLTKPNQRRYESKSIQEMISIAHQAVERGLIQVVMTEVR